MFADFAEKLRIPPSSDSQFMDENVNHMLSHMVLQSPSGQEWKVELKNTNNKLGFGRGWKEFVNYHRLQMGDFLVFKHVAKSYLNPGCLKNMSASCFEKSNIDPNKRHPSSNICNLNQSMGNSLLIDLESDDEKNHECGVVAENQRKRKFSFLAKQKFC
ncbi:hypothetical protein SUGI_0774480 [Cryptomeria japonica]|nr:hypothetical protein SUGI_0774480 [Cryptomeria japonica]